MLFYLIVELVLFFLFLDYGFYRLNYRLEMVLMGFVKNENFIVIVDYYVWIIKSDFIVVVYFGGVSKI